MADSRDLEHERNSRELENCLFLEGKFAKLK